MERAFVRVSLRTYILYTHRQTDRHHLIYIPRRFAGDQVSITQPGIVQFRSNLRKLWPRDTWCRPTTNFHGPGVNLKVTAWHNVSAVKRL